MSKFQIMDLKPAAEYAKELSKSFAIQYDFDSIQSVCNVSFIKGGHVIFSARLMVCLILLRFVISTLTMRKVKMRPKRKLKNGHSFSIY